MDFRFSPAQQAFRADIRRLLAEHWAPPDRPRRYRPGYLPDPVLERKLGERGWLGLTWPPEYGGGGRSPMDNLVLAEELAAVSAPGVETLGHTTVGPSLLIHGNEEQKQTYVRGLCRGELSFCLGYSEPGAGSDLAALECQARLDGDHYIVSGRKVWTSGAHIATHCWLAARTNPDAGTKHRGISVLIVPMDSPGITVRPIPNMVGELDFNEVVFTDVAVPRQNLVGGENEGWRVLTAALASERVGLYPAWGHERLLRAVREVVRNGRDGLRDARLEQLAALHCELWVARLLTYRAAWLESKGMLTPADAAAVKLFNSELCQRVYQFAVQAIGLEAQAWGDRLPELGSLAAHGYLSMVQGTIGGGTSEIQRNLIAIRGLGLPRD